MYGCTVLCNASRSSVRLYNVQWDDRRPQMTRPPGEVLSSQLPLHHAVAASACKDAQASCPCPAAGSPACPASLADLCTPSQNRCPAAGSRACPASLAALEAPAHRAPPALAAARSAGCCTAHTSVCQSLSGLSRKGPGGCSQQLLGAGEAHGWQGPGFAVRSNGLRWAAQACTGTGVRQGVPASAPQAPLPEGPAGGARACTACRARARRRPC